MSDGITENGQEEVKPEVNANPEQKQMSEADKALLKARDDFKNDMFKYKERAKQAEERLQMLEAQSKQREIEQLEKNEEWKVLYENEKAARVARETEAQEIKRKMVDSAKVNAVIQKLGGFKKSDYNKFIDVEKVSLTESGTIDNSTLEAEVERLRQNYPELLAKQTVKNQIPDAAPTNAAAKPLDLNKMNSSQLKELYGKLNKK